LAKNFLFRRADFIIILKNLSKFFKLKAIKKPCFLRCTVGWQGLCLLSVSKSYFFEAAGARPRRDRTRRAELGYFDEIFLDFLGSNT